MRVTEISKLTLFRLYAPDAREVRLAGDFNDWQPELLSRVRRNGRTWEIFFNLKPGEYQYKFLVDGQWQADPHAALTARNPFGTLNSVIQVE